MQVSNTNKRFSRKPSTDPAAMMLGKIPPQARELEEAILGAIMEHYMSGAPTAAGEGSNDATAGSYDPADEETVATIKELIET